MHLCYIDESGVSQIPGNTSHFVLAALTVPVSQWKYCDEKIRKIKTKYYLLDQEIHTAWILRKYLEQSKIPDFDSMDYAARRTSVMKLRNKELYKLQKASAGKRYKQTKKNFNKTSAYIHLTYEERVNFISEIAEEVASWDFSRLFAECIDKLYFDPTKNNQTIDEQAFEQIVTRFELFLKNIESHTDENYGLLIHDNNETVSTKHTKLMKKFYDSGTLWIDIQKIIETPLFVDSELTSMVQIADLCSYAIRRYLENDEEDLFNLVYKRADRNKSRIVGVRHFTESCCSCKICKNHC